jgi:hypothetical protein
MTVHPAAQWAEANLRDPLHIDCTTSLMLKILDGKCKMNTEEKTAVAIMYDVIKHRSGKFLGKDIHHLIDEARASVGTNDEMLEDVYEKRVLAETMISRPVMKAFKAILRGERIIGN